MCRDETLCIAPACFIRSFALCDVCVSVMLVSNQNKITMSISRAVVKLSIVLDGEEEIIKEVDFDDFVHSSFENDDDGELQLEDLKNYIIEEFIGTHLKESIKQLV
ncbi:hypothetical protein KBY79_10685 [Synechococcus lacustris C3-12m-Tous]|uniref:hypothetical protein n=1 Tax=Synechococcus lacustris TaxID=2116544 RepID=UPI0020CEEAF8|nr:hypothetical protein [Synechococcus lacustris]MCP9925676.1 hypothetical protein [Synechococcus lacustris C3-12m-Tous]